MKALICEICGGNELVKDGDYFVCQYCGCKYTLEDAKKMLVEGSVKIEGTVQVEITPYNRLLERIDAFLQMKEYSDAANTAQKFIQEYPNKYIGYMKLFIAESKNYDEDIKYKNSDILYNRINSMWTAANEEEKKEIEPFFKKSIMYTNWISETHNFEERYEELQKKLKTCKTTLESKKELKDSENTTKMIYLLVTLISLMVCFALPPIGGLGLIAGLVGFFSHGTKKRIEEIEKEIEEIEKETEEIEKEIKVLEIDRVAMEEKYAEKPWLKEA